VVTLEWVEIDSGRIGKVCLLPAGLLVEATPNAEALCHEKPRQLIILYYPREDFVAVCIHSWSRQ
jgi:hypothetical protein